MTVRTTILTYTDDRGEPLVQLVHKSVRLRHAGDGPVKGSQAYAEAPDWAVEFARPYGWENNGGGLPRELGNGRPDGIAATSLADATEALARIGDALQVWIAARESADAALVQRVAAAARYGQTPELPLGDAGQDLADLVKGVQRDAPALLDGQA